MSALELAIQDAYWGDLTQLKTVQFVAGFNNEQAAKVCFVSPHTYRRWRIDRKPNPACVRLLAIYAGYMPWPGWNCCRVLRGKLYTQHSRKHGFVANEIAGMEFLRRALVALQDENKKLRERLARERVVSAQHDCPALYSCD